MPGPKQMLMIFREAPVISGPSQPASQRCPGTDTSPPSLSPPRDPANDRLDPSGRWGS